jgi:two-component system cell cycle sensor histidine kinase/response regulator CckA
VLRSSAILGYRPYGPVTSGFSLLLATREICAVMPPARETVLVVDDEEMVRRLAARILLGQGYRVLEASGGHEAVQMLQHAADRIDGVVTDVAMPGLGGRQLGQTISRCWPRVRVLYMSGFPMRRMVDEGALDPTSPFLQKPFTTEQLTRKVREMLAEPMEQ